MPALTAAMLTQARAPRSLGKHMGRMRSSPIVVITNRLSAKKLPSPATACAHKLRTASGVDDAGN